MASAVHAGSPPEAAVAPHDGGLWEFAAGRGLQALVVGTSKDPNAKLTVLLVSPEGDAPSLAVKAPTTAAAEAAVDAEVRVLTELRKRGLGPLEETVPRVVGRVAFEGRRAAVIGALPGRPMSTLYSRRGHTANADRVRADFQSAGAWLAELQRQTAAGRAPVELDGGVVSRLRDRFGDDPNLGADLDRLTAIHARLRHNEVARTVVHGDFWFGNLLVRDGCVSGVVDWEAASMSGEPVRDLVRFANVYALYLDRRTRPGRRVGGHPGLRADEWGAGIEYALDAPGWFPTLYRRFLQDGLARLGADPAGWRDAALAGVAEVAALTDHHEFARLHLELFRRLTSQESA